jgi:protein-L-isoaspartate(D-aspartate) O-methyltransferase
MPLTTYTANAIVVGMDVLAAHREFYADLVTAAAPKPNDRLRAAFASVRRERYLGPGPWKIFALGGGYVETPNDDPVFLYQDVVVGLVPERLVNNGQPALHAACLGALNVTEGQTVVHVGAGTGYYTALLAALVGAGGSVVAYEIAPDLAEAAARNLRDLPNVTVHPRSAAEGPLPPCDAVYVSAGATSPLDVWLDALKPGGRLLFPLTALETAVGLPAGAMLLVTRTEDPERFDARFVCPAAFIPCAGAFDEDAAVKLAAAFKRGDARSVRSLRHRSSPDATSWCDGPGWWLSTT